MGVSYLLDAHVLLWLLGEPEKVPEHVRSQLADPRRELLVSAASAMEVAAKTRLGKLDDAGLIAAWSRRLAEIGAVELPLTSAHCVLAGSMAWEHRDPFDRLLAATAIEEGATLVTVDRAFATLPAPRTLRW